MEQIITQFLTLYGPLGMGWIVAGIIWWKTKDGKDDSDKLADDYHSAIVENTKVIERLTTLLDERTRRGK